MENLKPVNIGDKVYCLYQIDDDEPTYCCEYVLGVGANGFWISGSLDRDPNRALYISEAEIGEEFFFDEDEAYRAVQDIIQDRICDAYEAAKEEGFR